MLSTHFTFDHEAARREFDEIVALDKSTPLYLEDEHRQPIFNTAFLCILNLR